MAPKMIVAEVITAAIVASWSFGWYPIELDLIRSDSKICLSHTVAGRNEIIYLGVDKFIAASRFEKSSSIKAVMSNFVGQTFVKPMLWKRNYGAPCT